MNDERRIGRRTFLKSAVISTAGYASASLIADIRQPGLPACEQGTRSPFEQLRKRVGGQMLTYASTPIHQLHGMMTPSDLHFERSHSGTPAISPDSYKLLIHGLVENSLTFTLAELKRFPSCSRITFLECSGNCQDYFKKGPQTTPQELAGQTSQSEWTGVALPTLLRETGLKSKAKWLLAEGGDAALMTRSIPLGKALDDAMICYAQNGEAIRPEQGYPVRLLLPGWEGSSCVKWLRRLEVGDKPWMTREETAKYTEPLLNNTARQFSFVMDARSVITSPVYPAQLEKGWHEIRGLAWSGRGSIKRVEVSVDGGDHWQPATLHGPVLDKAHTRFSLPWHWQGKDTLLLSRVTDSTGYRQPWVKELVAVRGIGSLHYHNNGIIGWRVKSDGCVYYEPVVG
ncbi:sulfite dehydrogenase [Sansalvadorimonas verongulae]|uniref:sulfite dehydrogenase n=1 Tax=Sansalvadorimonas verongulae TaxID=2172824 RepID=UPI0012BCAF7C|nr:sulfite dehydrogenase [Sansalvadorimonas verongulae]MTI14614.1 sulfite dehydrogenase [Sansalvadorimonas verongulae]